MNIKTLTLALLVSSMAFINFACSPVTKTGTSSKTKISNDAAEVSLEELIARYPEVSYSDLRTIIKNKSALIMDANSPQTYAAGHIPTAINFRSLGDKLLETLPADKSSLIVAYCGSPTCLAWLKAAEKMTSMGYTNIKHFKGGLKGWKQAGGKLVRH